MRSVVLFCLPFSGGNQYSFRDLKAHLSPYIQMHPLDYPGRGRRMREPLLDSVELMVDDIFEQIRPQLQQPYAIYGHSLGACVGHLLIHKILDEGYKPPIHLFVSGRGAPSIPDDDEKMYLLPRNEFYEKLREFGGTTEEVLNNQALMDLFEPILRNDFRASETYVHQITRVLDVPITVMTGDQEDFTEEEMQGWSLESNLPVKYLQFSGGHFFIFDHWREIGEEISERLVGSDER